MTASDDSGGACGTTWRPRAVALSPRAVRKLTDVRPPVHRLRVGDWRVLFVMTPERLEVERIVNRREAY